MYLSLPKKKSKKPLLLVFRTFWILELQIRIVDLLANAKPIQDASISEENLAQTHEYICKNPKIKC